MAYLNEIKLIGNAGKAPEVRTFDDGNKIANVSLATTKHYKDRSGKTVDQTTWFNLVFMGNLAKTAEEFIDKGTMMYVSGEMVCRSYINKDNVQVYSWEVRVDKFQLLSSKPKENNGDWPKERPAASAFGEDLPF